MESFDTVFDTIKIRDLKFYAYHGVLAEEKKLGQEYIIDIDMMIDRNSIKSAGKSDDIDLSVNYADVCKVVKSVTTTNKYDLIEALAEEIARSVLHMFTKVGKIRVEVKKPSAPINMNFGYVAVDILRSKEDYKL